MKIEIDLTDILFNHNGDLAETMQESIKRQVIEYVASEAKKATEKHIRDEVNRVLTETLQEAVRTQMPGIVTNLMDTPYTPIDRYGDRKGPTTFRSELLRKIQEEMVYKKTGYSSERNAFTKAVDDTVSAHLDTFRKEFAKQVDGNFVTEAMGYATQRLRERLGVPK